MKRREEADAATQIRRANKLLAQYRRFLNEDILEDKKILYCTNRKQQGLEL